MLDIPKPKKRGGRKKQNFVVFGSVVAANLSSGSIDNINKIIRLDEGKAVEAISKI